MKRIVILAAALLMSCAVVEPAVVFRDPTTGQIGQCTSMTAEGASPRVNVETAQHETDPCAAAYSKRGWMRQ
jgi:hypothetical protein